MWKTFELVHLFGIYLMENKLNFNKFTLQYITEFSVYINLDLPSTERKNVIFYTQKNRRTEIPLYRVMKTNLK